MCLLFSVYIFGCESELFYCEGLQEMGQLYLPACKERWTTSAVLLGETLIYGDRAGNIHSALVSQSQHVR